MTQRTETFIIDGHPSVQISMRAGDVRLVRGTPGEVTVAVDGSASEGFRIEQIGDLVVVEAGKSRGLRFRSADVSVRVPEGADVEVRVAAGDVTASVALGTAEISTTAGDVRLADARDVRLKTASGDVTMGTIRGDVTASSASGDVSVVSVEGELSAKTMSGDVTIDAFGGTRCVAGTMAGDIRIGIPAGRSLRVDVQTLSGEVRNDLPFRAGDPSGEIELNLKTLSGDIVLGPA